MARPELQFVLLDSNRKKARFCRQAVMELALENVEIKNEFLKRGIQLCVDGHDPAFVRKMLSKVEIASQAPS